VVLHAPPEPAGPRRGLRHRPRARRRRTGRAWYRAGKQEHKHNTFSDFIACAEHLIAQGLTSAEQLAISGGSAGGLLIGAVLNQRPELFRAAIAEVPFVDVLNTMLDPDLPLTVTEYDEWGNPEEPGV
jgi:oligopeptidase B